MTNEERNTALYQKMAAEQDTYRAWLLNQPPEEILKHTYEYTVREDIVMCMEELELSDAQAEALLESSSPLADVYGHFEKLETGYMDVIRDSIENRAKEVVEAKLEQQRLLRETPVYRYPGDYAQEHGELEAYLASHKANVACSQAIETAISDHYHDNRLGKDAALEVMEAFGVERTMYVLANTVRQKEWDGRISHSNKAWAQTIPVYEDKDAWGHNRNIEFVVDKCNPGLTDIFLNQVRREQLLRTPLSDEEIKQEGTRLLSELQRPAEPNSPNGTHFMAQISPDFLARASSKDMNRLMKHFPFSSITFCGLKDRKGQFVLIPKEENRNQPLKKLRRSVRKDLQRVSEKTSPSAPKKTKAKQEER